MNYIDIGIDFGAENIVVIAIGYDNKGRKDYRLISFDSNFAIKNYIGQKLNDDYEIGYEVKLSYAHHNSDKSYKWVEGRYKSNLSGKITDLNNKILSKLENKNQVSINNEGLVKKSEELVAIGLKLILDKIEKFDFSPYFQGSLRNIAVGIPQSWDNERKDLYYNTISQWKYGEIFLLSEPVSATIAAINKSLSDISEKPIMILDIGASTLDISFSKYNQDNNNISIYKTAKRIDNAGHFFDIIFASVALAAEINKQAKYHLISRVDILRLRKIEDYIKYISENQSKYSSLLLEIESIKENNLVEIIKFNKKKLIDTNHLSPLTVNKEIYDMALKYYISIINKDINVAIADFEKETKNTEKDIFPLLCGGISSLYNFEKRLKENIKYGDNIISISEGNNNKIDITIALGLAYYAQDKTIISKTTDYQISCDFFIDDNKEAIIIFDYDENYPLKENKKLSSLINDDQEIIFQGKSNEIGFNLNFKKDNQVTTKAVQATFKNIEKGDLFDIYFNLDINDRLSIEIKNLSNAESFKTYQVI